MERFCPVSPRSSCRGSGVAVSSIRGFFPGVALGHKGGGWRGKGHGDSQVKDWYKGETNVKERDRCGRETGVQEKNISAVGRARSTLRVLLVVGDQRGSMGSSSGCYQKPCAQI